MLIIIHLAFIIHIFKLIIILLTIIIKVHSFLTDLHTCNILFNKKTLSKSKICVIFSI